ncbi:hypothetical protein ID866_6652 [Astraeus odoratus]|nr:hypothetical protein ID866_6652 [Astraeus odoratus]
MTATVAPLPPYPSTQSRKSLSASQLAQFHLNVASALAETIALPPAKRDTPATRTFISTYAGDAAYQVLQGLIWKSSESPGPDERIGQRVLVLAEKLASSLDLRTLLNLCVGFPSSSSRLKAILASALAGMPPLPSMFADEVVPSFTVQLSPARSSGLYALRKTAHCLLSLLRPCPPELVRPFAHSTEFVLALARAYDEGLASLSRSYGGFRAVDGTRSLDDWERVWIETKVDIVDAFHVLVTCLVADLAAVSGTQLPMETERAFGIVNMLVEDAVTPEGGGTPFLDRSLIADYQHAYDLDRMLGPVVQNAARENARLHSLDAALRTLTMPSLTPHGGKDPGILRLVLKSSGIQASNSGSHEGKGKAKATTPVPVAQSNPPLDPDIDLKITQVLDIFPDLSSDYVRKMLEHPSYPFQGSAEKVIEALLEGTAPDEASLETNPVETFAGPQHVPAPIVRRNIFDDDIMDTSRVRIGKKQQDETIFTRDRAEVERMKANILRRIETMHAEDDGSEDTDSDEAAYMDDDDLGNTSIKLTGDGEESSGDDDDVPKTISPETILELAYIRDPKLFDRDAQTRRSKARADLKAQTGM